MTALVYLLQAEQVCLAMDTLVIEAEDRKPMSFQRKFLGLPDNAVRRIRNAVRRIRRAVGRNSEAYCAEC
jgi:hypothetical protein